jgi:hypothetical protein
MSDKFIEKEDGEISWAMMHGLTRGRNKKQGARFLAA